MGLQLRSLTMLVLLIWFLRWPIIEAQTPASARSLDAILQDYAYRAFVRPRTGVVYDGFPPSNLTGIQISAIRLRSGSLYTRGVEAYKEFRIPIGVKEQTYVERLVLVYQNLGNWSNAYYPLPGYIYLSPVLGLLAYDASDLSAKNLPELPFRASEEPISIEFLNVRRVPDGSIVKCVWFDLNGKTNFTNLVSGSVCETFELGHFSIVVESTTAPSPAPAPPPPPPSRGGGGGNGNGKRVGIIVGAVAGGIALLVLLALLILWIWRFNKKKKMNKMEKAADSGEALQMTTVGNTKAPAATTTRTQPSLETEYVP